MPNGSPSPMAPQGNALQRAPATPPFNVAAHVDNNWQQAQAQHKQLLDSKKRMDSVRRELDSLMQLKDTVTVEDVIKGAGVLVGTGFSPTAIAQMLSTMPTTGGQAMQAWIAQQEQAVQGMEAQLRAKVRSSSIHKGITALASLHVQHIKDGLQASSAGLGPPRLGVGGGPPPMQGGGEEEDEG